MRHSTSWVWVVGAVMIFAACGDSTGPNRRLGIRFVAGDERTDTAGAVLTQALIVEVRDSSGNIVPAGTVVRFQSAGTTFGEETYVGRLTGSAFFTFLTEMTDAAGRVAVLVRLGFKAGPARLVVSVPQASLLDTALFTVTAGNPASISITPADTMLYVGRSFTAAGTVTDAYGNPRSGTLSWSTTGSGVSVTSAGVVSATAIGRYTITATLPLSGGDPLTGEATVSVVPEFLLTAWRIDADPTVIVAQGLDGSNRRELASVQDGGIGAGPAWIPGGENIVYTVLENDGFQRLRVVDLQGVVRPFFATQPAALSHQAEPAPAAGSNWVFFSAFNTACGGAGDYCLHRATRTGASVTLLAAGFPSRQPSPSPDGSKVAFTRDDFSGEIRVLDVATNAVSTWSIPGFRPSWSPLADKIAYVASGSIRTFNPDGTGQVSLTGSSRYYWSSPIRWSPDGKWIVARSDFGLDLIEVATGTVIPLPNTSGLTAASLK